MPPTEEIMRCSFCGKTQHEVRKLIAGPGVYICDECVALTTDIMAEEGGRTATPPGLRFTPAQVPAAAAILSDFAQRLRDRPPEAADVVAILQDGNTWKMVIASAGGSSEVIERTLDRTGEAAGD